MSRTRAVGLFLALATLWGLSFPAIEAGLAFLPPVLFAALRYDVAAVLLLGVALLTGRDLRVATRGDVLAVAAIGCFLVAGNSLLFVGQQTITGSVAAIIYSLIPILTALFAVLLLPDERLSALGLLGVILGFVGAAIIAQPDPANLLSAGTVGMGFVLAAAVSVALGGVLVRRADPSFGRLPLTGWGMLLGGLLLHAGSLLVGESTADATLSPVAVGALVYLGVAATAVAFLIYFTLLAEYGPLQSNLVSYAVPVVATVAGALLLDEQVTGLTLVGFLVILSGFLLLQRRAVRATLRSLFREDATPG